MQFTDNLRSVLNSYEGLFPSGAHVLTVANVMEYARYLHEAQGYFVFNDQKLVQIGRKNIQQLIESGQPLTDSNIVNALDKSGYEYVNWLLEQTGGVQPPIRAGEGRRAATRGGWATITGNLRASFRHKVDGERVRDSGQGNPNPKQATLPFPS